MAGEKLRAQLSQRGLANIEVIGPLSIMREVYKRARIVIAPSQWIETWGRIATEAHFSGIPVLASNTGGLPEAVGSAGMCIPANAPHAVWLSHLSRMWDDHDYYEALSQAAYRHAARADIQEDSVVDSFIDFARASLDGPVQRSIEATQR